MQLQRQWDIEDRDEQRAYSRLALSQLVEDADKAGINPIAVLGSGSAPPYNAAAGFAPLSRSAPVRQAVGGSPLGSAVGAAADGFLQAFDPYANDRRNESFRIVGSAIATRNAASLSRVPRGAASVARGSVVPSKPLVSKTVYGPQLPKGAGPNGEILDNLVWWRDSRSNKLVQYPNAELPESEQFLVRPIGAAENTVMRPLETKLQKGFSQLRQSQKSGFIRTTPATPAQIKANEQSWHRGWLPSIGFNWK